MSTTDNVVVGDLKSNKKGAGARRNSGKVSFSQIPMHLLAGTARVLMGGLIKYAPFNWAKGMPWSVPFDCCQRHLLAWWYCHEELDPESGEHHIDHAICNLLMLKHYLIAYREGDDRAPSSADFESGLDDFMRRFDEKEYRKRNYSDQLPEGVCAPRDRWHAEDGAANFFADKSPDKARVERGTESSHAAQ